MVPPLLPSLLKLEVREVPVKNVLREGLLIPLLLNRSMVPQSLRMPLKWLLVLLAFLVPRVAKQLSLLSMFRTTADVPRAVTPLRQPPTSLVNLSMFSVDCFVKAPIEALLDKTL